MASDVLKICPLFAGIEEAQLDALLKCMNASKRLFARDEFIFAAEDEVKAVGVVLSGGVHVIQEDFWGNRVILAHIEPGGMFGEAFSCTDTERFPVSAVAVERAEIMLVDYRRITKVCTNACEFHTNLIMNMLHVLAEKNILLTRKMEHLSKRTTREKLLSFLSAQIAQSMRRTGGNVVEIPFNRQELADYLCVDRSALSRELGLMQKEGFLHYDKNRFELLRDYKQ